MHVQGNLLNVDYWLLLPPVGLAAKRFLLRCGLKRQQFVGLIYLIYCDR